MSSVDFPPPIPLGEKTVLEVERKVKSEENASINKVMQEKIGDGICLVGTSSVGKTTLLNAIKKIEGAPREELQADILGPQKIIKWLADHCEDFGVSKEDFTLLKDAYVDIHEALYSKDYRENNFREGFNPVNAGKVITAAEKLSEPTKKIGKEIGAGIIPTLLDELSKLSKTGKKFSFDHSKEIEILSDHSISHETPLRVVFVYLPFIKLSERLDYRNAHPKDPSDTRLGVGPLVQFAKLFKKKEKGEPIADTVTKGEVIAICYKHHEQYKQSLTSAELEAKKKDGSLEENFNKDLQEILSGLGFEEGDGDKTTLDLTPRSIEKYDWVIDLSTLEGDPETATQRLAADILKITPKKR